MSPTDGAPGSFLAGHRLILLRSQEDSLRNHISTNDNNYRDDTRSDPGPLRLPFLIPLHC